MKGEDAACTYLANRRFEILERNWRTKYGEIDCIAVRDGKIHFIEVKTRHEELTESYSPLSAIDRRKRKKIRQLAEHFLQQRKDTIAELRIRSVSCDLIAVSYGRDSAGAPDSFRVAHLPGVY